MTKTFKVLDTTGAVLRQFKSWKEANNFCISRGRMDWTIK